ncbi:uncharacterized protein LOC122080857 [Macadamia integrifolia]|uniref:uncharacterized protein LOC122080857 n=1 Tax=Macadamia integrifolia TaxID=60698 RepID=UPI001C4E6DB2|nr:uncharacterized protein LOC122080857 [Macadamia integrifolia]
MGKDWSWGGRSTTTSRKAERETTSGCISGVLQLFPLHQPCFKTPISSFLQEDPTILEGPEAPRNSLESEEGPCMGTVSLSSIMKEGDLNLPMGIRIGTKVDNAGRGETKGRMEENLSNLETSNSPAITKTPNLVARLMGLDVLPDGFSPSFSCSSSTSSSVHTSTRSEKIACAALKRDLRSRRNLHCRTNSNINFKEREVRYETMTGSRSLPDTPRISSARSSADADPRLSLQINKENLMLLPEELQILSRNSFSYSPYSTKSRKKEWRQGENENKSPSYSARHIVKQVKDSVGRRKMGLDITNTTGNGANEGEGDSPTIKSQKKKRLSRTRMADESTPSCSPRLRFLELKNKPVTVTSTSNDSSSHSRRPSSKPLQFSSPQPTPSPPQPSLTTRKPKCQKGNSSERFSQRLTKPPKISETVRNKREEAFVRAFPATKANLSDKKCKKTPLSNDLVNIAVPSVVLLNKEQQDSSTTQKPAAQESKRSPPLSSGLSRKYNKQEETEALAHQDDNKGNKNGGGSDAEFRYVKGILLRTGIFRDGFVSIRRWYSPCHPLNPLIFHHLEHSFPYSKIENEKEVEDLGLLRPRCNRKLMFELVDEILEDELRPYLNMKPWLRRIDRGGFSPKDTQMTGLQLLERLWFRIQSYPAANCQILQDIDALVEKDLPDANMRTLFPEEGESIVFEIEHHILDSLLRETAADLDSGLPVNTDRPRIVRSQDRHWNVGTNEGSFMLGDDVSESPFRTETCNCRTMMRYRI